MRVTTQWVLQHEYKMDIWDMQNFPMAFPQKPHKQIAKVYLQLTSANQQIS